MKEQYFEKLITHSAKINKTFAGALLDKGRQQFDVESRNMCYNVLRKLNWSLPDIGNRFNRGHATVIHGIKNHDIAYARGGYYMDNYDDLVIRMADNTEMEKIENTNYIEKNRIKFELLEDSNVKLKEELFDIKKTTRLLLRSIKEQQSLTNLLNKSCS